MKGTIDWNPIVDRYEQIEEELNLLPIPSHCSLGIRNCTNMMCPVGKTMLKIIWENDR